MKKIFSILVAVVFLTNAFVVSALAEETTSTASAPQTTEKTVKESGNKGISLVTELAKASGKSTDEVVKVLSQQRELGKIAKALGLRDEQFKALLQKLGVAPKVDNSKKTQDKVVVGKTGDTEVKVNTKTDVKTDKKPEVKVKEDGKGISLVAELMKASGKSADEVVKVLSQQRELGKISKALGINDDQYKGLLQRLGVVKKAEPKIKKAESAVDSGKVVRPEVKTDKKADVKQEVKTEVKGKDESKGNLFINELAKVSGKDPIEVAQIMKEQRELSKMAAVLGLTEDQIKTVYLRLFPTNKATEVKKVDNTVDTTKAGAVEAKPEIKTEVKSDSKESGQKGISLVAILSYLSGKSSDEVAKVIAEQRELGKIARTLGLNDQQYGILMQKLGAETKAPTINNADVNKVPTTEIKPVVQPEAKPPVQPQVKESESKGISIVAELANASGKSTEEVVKVLSQIRELGAASRALGMTDDQFKALMQKLSAVSGR